VAVQLHAVSPALRQLGAAAIGGGGINDTVTRLSVQYREAYTGTALLNLVDDAPVDESALRLSNPPKTVGGSTSPPPIPGGAITSRSSSGDGGAATNAGGDSSESLATTASDSRPIRQTVIIAVVTTLGSLVALVVVVFSVRYVRARNAFRFSIDDSGSPLQLVSNMPYGFPDGVRQNSIGSTVFKVPPTPPGSEPVTWPAAAAAASSPLSLPLQAASAPPSLSCSELPPQTSPLTTFMLQNLKRSVETLRLHRLQMHQGHRGQQQQQQQQPLETKSCSPEALLHPLPGSRRRLPLHFQLQLNQASFGDSGPMGSEMNGKRSSAGDKTQSKGQSQQQSPLPQQQLLPPPPQQQLLIHPPSPSQQQSVAPGIETSSGQQLQSPAAKNTPRGHPIIRIPKNLDSPPYHSAGQPSRLLPYSSPQASYSRAGSASGCSHTVGIGVGMESRGTIKGSEIAPCPEIIPPCNATEAGHIGSSQRGQSVSAGCRGRDVKRFSSIPSPVVGSLREGPAAMMATCRSTSMEGSLESAGESGAGSASGSGPAIGFGTRIRIRSLIPRPPTHPASPTPAPFPSPALSPVPARI
ncbi:hypothetical protein Vretimale_16137, partial [Volvox reticuliferus]